MRIVQTLIIIIFLFSISYAQFNNDPYIKFYPINHASLIIEYDSLTIYVDPVQNIYEYKSYPKPNIILVTDIHRDHFNDDVINKLKNDNLEVICPKVVFDQLKYGKILNNGDEITLDGITVKAIPMYNITKGRLKFHEKGRGNGYVLTLNNKRVYISGDTEDIKEMRELKNIDYAFVCMNLPYTMTIEQAASAVLEFRPKVVYPYHYRGTKGYSDIQKFKKLVSTDKYIDVRLLNWYK